MASRDVELCNLALIKLGDKPIADFTDGAVGSLCEKMFSTALYAFSTFYTWTWNEKVIAIDPVADATPIYYEYEFQLPTDFLQLRYIDDFDTMLQVTNYDIRMKTLYCNYEKIIIRYASRVTADDLPYMCDDAFSSYLAHRLAPSLEDVSRAQQLWQEFLQKGQSVFLEDAKQRKSPIDRNDYTPDSRW